jgi:hypothetical protein
MTTYKHTKNPLNDASHVKGQIRKVESCIRLCYELGLPETSRLFQHKLKKLQKVQAEHQQILDERTEWDNI